MCSSIMPFRVVQQYPSYRVYFFQIIHAQIQSERPIAISLYRCTYIAVAHPVPISIYYVMRPAWLLVRVAYIKHYRIASIWQNVISLIVFSSLRSKRKKQNTQSLSVHVWVPVSARNQSDYHLSNPFDVVDCCVCVCVCVLLHDYNPYVKNNHIVAESVFICSILSAQCTCHPSNCRRMKERNRPKHAKGAMSFSIGIGLLNKSDIAQQHLYCHGSFDNIFLRAIYFLSLIAHGKLYICQVKLVIIIIVEWMSAWSLNKYLPRCYLIG